MGSACTASLAAGIRRGVTQGLLGGRRVQGPIRLAGRFSRRSTRSRGVAATPGVSRAGALDGHSRGGGSFRTGILRSEAEPFLLGAIPAAADQHHSSLLTTSAAAAASTSVVAPGAQLQQQQQPRKQSGSSEDRQPHQEGGREHAQEDQNFDETEQEEGTS